MKELTSDTMVRGREKICCETFQLLLAAANEGVVDAQYNLAVLLEGDNGFLHDSKAALRYYCQAAEHAHEPHAKAAFAAGRLYFSGDATDCPKDLSRAHYYYSIGVRLRDANAMNALGILYETGQGCPQDYERALELFQQAEEMDHVHGAFNLASLYYSVQDYTKAQEYFRRALELGHPWAKQHLIQTRQHKV